MTKEMRIEAHPGNMPFIMVYEDVWQALLNDPHAMVVYMALIRRTHAGNRAWYSKKRVMAQESGVGQTTFENRIKKLADIGLVRVTPQYRNPETGEIGLSRSGGFVEQIQNIYTVRDRMPPTRETGDPHPRDGRPSHAERATPTRETGPNIDPLHTSPTQIPNTHDHPSADRFDEFWSVAPKKVGKVAARKAWKKATTIADPSEIIEGMRRYRDDPNRVDAFTKNPQGWLNDGRWEDDPLPPRDAPKSASRGGVENTLEAWGYTETGSTLPWEDPAPTFDDAPFIDAEVY